MGRIKAFYGLLCAYALWGSATTALAFTYTVSQSGVSVHWTGKSSFDLAGNPKNVNGISETDFYQSVVRGLQRWKAASNGILNFDYWQGTDAKVFEPDSNYNGLSSIYFASNNPDSRLSANVLGLTQVWYNTNNGQIMEADIVLNDVNYRFTTDPRDTSGFGLPNGLSTDGRNVFIDNVITHELGHVFGLSHSGGLQSTMLFMESPEQAYLGCDEQIGIQALYNSLAGFQSGKIHGKVVSETSGKAIFGAQVVVISRHRGTVLATAITDRNGNYAIGGMEPGQYFLMVEPFFAGASVLPAYYASVSPNICGTRPFGRTFLMDESGLHPRSIQVKNGADTEVPVLTASCGTYNGAAVAPVSDAQHFSRAPMIYDGTSGETGFGVVDQINVGSSYYYRLQSVSGHLEIHGVGYSLYSPIHPSIQLLDGYGNDLSSVVYEDNVYVGRSGFRNYDSKLVADGLPFGDYYVLVRATPLEASYYPAGPISLDSVPFLLLTGFVNEPDPDFNRLSNSARCHMSEDFPAYHSPSNGPVRHSTTNDDGGTGFCGTLSNKSDGEGGSGGPGAAAIAGWLLPWLSMALMPQLLISGRRRSAICSSG